MSYQLPPLNEEGLFERLIRDILRRVYNDPGIEVFGRRGQSQFGIDGFSPVNSGITFQCKLKDTRYESDEQLRRTLLKEMEEEFEKTQGLTNQPHRFVFATTFKNDRQLQQRAISLSSAAVTVEYWGWDTINEKIWEFAESLIPAYYPLFPIGQIPGFKQVTLALIEKAQVNDLNELNKLALEYYRINDRDDVVFKVICNDIDVRNDRVMSAAFDRLKALPLSGTLWILGAGGCGKTTILHRLAIELARNEQNVFMLNLETYHSENNLEEILSLLKYSSTYAQTALCIDNPVADEETLEALLRRIPDYCSDIHILLAERVHRYKTLQKTGCLTYLHGEEELDPIIVQNTRRQRQKVYSKLFDLLQVSDADASLLRDIALDQRLVYVHATYSILLELKKKRKIDFNFDWDDYRKLTGDLPAFREGYRYIALFYLFGVRAPFSVLSKIFGSDVAEQKTFLERFRGFVNEPIIVDEKRDDSFRKSIYVRTKHEIVSEIFFQEHPGLDKNELLMEWCEHTDFEDAIESQALINIFGARKNYLVENYHINFHHILDFLLNGNLSEKIAYNPKLNGTLHLAKFWLLLFQGGSAKAVAAIESFLENTPEDLHIRTELARLYQSQGNLNDAEAVLLKVLGIKPTNLQARTELARIYQRQGRLDEAEDILLRLLELDVNNLQARTELAKIYQKQNKLDEAEAVLLEVLEIKPNDLQARTELAKIYQKQNKLDEAEAVLLEVLEIKPNDLNSRTELARIYQRQGRLDEAEDILLRLLELDVNNLQARTELARLYQSQGNLNDAEAVLLKVLEIKPNDLNSRTELAKIYQRQGRLNEAERVLKEEIELAPNALHPRTELARIYQRQGRLDEAIHRLEEYIELDPNGLHPRTELAKIYQRRGRLNEAERVLKEEIELAPNALHPRTELARIYQRQGRLDEAIHRLEEYIELDPNGLHPRTELAKIYQKQNKLDEAEAVLLKSLEIDSKQLHPRTELAKIYQRQDRLDEAEQTAEDVLKIDPLNDHALSELLAVWRLQGKKEDGARRFIEFVSQPRYRFSRYSQAPVFRFFQYCKAFNLKQDADFVYQRFRSKLDDRNLNFYRASFT